MKSEAGVLLSLVSSPMLPFHPCLLHNIPPVSLKAKNTGKPHWISMEALGATLLPTLLTLNWALAPGIRGMMMIWAKKYTVVRYYLLSLVY